MCRIDEPFGSHSLEEKTDPTDRFLQALDESGADGVFRDLLVRHFSASWVQELRSIEAIEKALTQTRLASDCAGKICNFVHALSRDHVNWFLDIYSGSIHPSFLGHFRKRYPARFAFAEEVAKIIFPESPYSFYQCFKDSISVRFEVFVLFYAPDYYGVDCHLTPLLFNDNQLAKLDAVERKSLLWAIFERLTPWDCSFSEHLRNLYAWDAFASVPTLETLRFSQAFDYLGAWISADSQKAEFKESYDLFFEFYEYLLNRRSELYKLTADQPVSSWSEDELEHYKI